MSNQVTPEQIDSLRVAIKHYIDKELMDDAEAEAFVLALAEADLSEGEMNTILQDLAYMAKGIPIISTTQVKVEAWRKFIQKLMLAGFLGVSLEKKIPGIYYLLYQELLTAIGLFVQAGYDNIKISELISPRSSIPIPPISMPDASGMLPFLKDKIISSFYTVAALGLDCMVGACGIFENLLNQLTKENFDFTVKLTGLMALSSGIPYAIQLLRGDFDGEIARLIESGQIGRILNGAARTVADISRSIRDKVIDSAIDVDNMSLGLNWNDIAPDRHLDVSTRDMLNNQLVTEINKRIDEFSGSHKSKSEFKLELLDDIVAILKLPEEEMIVAIQIFKDKYRDNNIPILIKLLTDKAADLEPGRKGFSQPDPVMPVLPSSASPKNISASLDPYDIPIGPNPMAARHDEKYNSGRPDAILAKEALINSGLIKKEEKIKKITWDQTDNLLNIFINIYLDAINPGLVKKLTLLSVLDHDMIINYIRGLAEENGAYSVITSFYEPLTQDRSLKELNNKFASMYKSVKSRMDTLSIDSKYNTVEGEPMPGGRRRRKSRQYKKRRMSQRRRTSRRKGRRTRKGKKNKATKRRR